MDTAAQRDLIPDRRERRRQSAAHRFTALGGVAALSLNALSSLAYGPELLLATLVTVGASAARYTTAVAIAVTALLIILVWSHRRAIATFPEGGGSYVIATRELGRGSSLIAAAAAVIDQVLTVAIGLAAGTAVLGSVFPLVADHPLATALIALAALTLLNLFGIAESAAVLLVPTLLYVVVIAAVVVVGLLRGEPVAEIGTPADLYDLPGVIGPWVALRAFALGSASLTGLEVVADNAAAFRAPAARRAQRTELMLGLLLAVLLLGIAKDIAALDILPRDGVTVLAQLVAAACGTGILFHAAGLVIAGTLGLAANTGFAGLPMLLSRLARDRRMPYLFALRAERPVFRYAVAGLAALAALALICARARVELLVPIYAVAVFVGFTVTQVGLVRHWVDGHGPRWRWQVLVGTIGAAATAVIAIVVFLAEFAEATWVLLFAVPALMLLFDRTEHYYREVADHLGLGTEIPVPQWDSTKKTIVVVPVATVGWLTRRALEAARRMGDEVHPIAVDVDARLTAALVERWRAWDPGLELRVLPSPCERLVEPIADYADSLTAPDTLVIVLLPRIESRRRRYRLLHNQRAPLIMSTLTGRTDTIAATITFHVD
ncbi:amino acid permease [Nocardia sp. CDC159]|uniref:Amino acid permease n=1 Tax=Nocardia pulmonis TaxID=2951408 RepID=A0A9X2EBB3_9NOCA|nr:MULTISPECIES: amino acid permease [Nocardia]MCM6776325.1 amino acid permease [Nocardia pulmonis]MCM6788749.1 amino acid permease [Nocardia sp. CDC159]